MYNKINGILNRYVEFNKSETEAFINILQPAVYKRHEHFLTEGQSVTKCCVVMDGIFEMYKLDEEGNEISIDFFFPVSFVTDYVSYLVTG